MNTPTPRTDAMIEQSWRSINFPNSPIPAELARQLESELATVTEQRDRLAEELKETQKHLKDANRGAEINAHALRINADKLTAVTEQLKEIQTSLKNTCADLFDEQQSHGLTKGKLLETTQQCDKLENCLSLSSSRLLDVTEQRDELLRYNEAYRQDALICANCDAISVKEYKEAIEQRNGLRSAVDYASDQLTRVTEQRDRLAEALQKNLLTTWIDEIEFEVFREAIAALKEETDDR